MNKLIKFIADLIVDKDLEERVLEAHRLNIEISKQNLIYKYNNLLKGL